MTSPSFFGERTYSSDLFIVHTYTQEISVERERERERERCAKVQCSCNDGKHVLQLVMLEADDLQLWRRVLQEGAAVAVAGKKWSGL
ncbi:hypothetical protein DAI22_09g045632 [Oryza sativa Japonica Group]|nr:hypothetical protein DAI22_09g045632 [Oryza sativa Japonica Group]